MKNPESYVKPKETLKFLEDLIRINSVNPSLVKDAPGESEIAEFIGNFMEKIGLETRLVEVEKNRPNAIGILKGSGSGPSLMLNGHTDTVGTECMEINPFEPLAEGNKMYGRGACDMKGGLASMLFAVKAIIDADIELSGDVLIAAVADEEYASVGTERVVKDCKTDAAIVCEPTGLQISVAHKGFVWLNIETEGKAAHGSRSDIGVDAITEMSKVLIEIEKLRLETFTKKIHKLVGSPSIHASVIEGGSELSTYPDHCRLQVERRIIPGETVDVVKEEIQGILDAIFKEDPQFKAIFNLILARGAMEISPEVEISQKLRHAILGITGVEPRYIGSSEWLDSEIIWNAHIPVVVFGPGGKGAHAAIEYVYIDQVITATKALARTITDFCR